MPIDKASERIPIHLARRRHGRHERDTTALQHAHLPLRPLGPGRYGKGGYRASQDRIVLATSGSRSRPSDINGLHERRQRNREKYAPKSPNTAKRQHRDNDGDGVEIYRHRK